ncbi:MAG: HAMP domain-containing protein [Blastocatellia bacterium]
MIRFLVTEALSPRQSPPAFGAAPAQFRAGGKLSVLIRIAPNQAVLATDPKPVSALPLWRRPNVARFFVAACFACLLCWFLARSLTQPIVELQQAARRLAAGETEYRLEVKRGDEIGQLANDAQGRRN